MYNSYFVFELTSNMRDGEIKINRYINKQKVKRNKNFYHITKVIGFVPVSKILLSY